MFIRMYKKKKRYTFGLLIDWIIGWEDKEYYQSLIVSGLSDFAKVHDVNIMCFVTGRVSSPNQWDQSRNILFDFVDSKKVDGLIVPTPAIGLYSNPEAVLNLIKGYVDIPIVTVGEHHPGYHAVTVDNYKSMRTIVDHLIEDHGYRRIAFVTGFNCRESAFRHKAYCDSLEAHHIAYDPNLVVRGNFLFDAGSQAVRSLREAQIQYDALVCSNDNMAVGAIIEFNRQKENVTDFLPVTGFDNSENGQLFGLTTVSQNFYNETRTAAELLLSIIEGKEAPESIEIPSMVITRSSCGCISKSVRLSDVEPDRNGREFSIEAIKETVLYDLKELHQTYDLVPEHEEEIMPFEEGIISAFFEEYQSGRKDQFNFAWKSFLHWIAQQKINPSFAQDILSLIRKHVISNLTGEAAIIAAENIFHSARMFIFEDLLSMGKSYFNPIQDENVDSLGEELMTSLDFNSQMKSMCRNLPKLGIHTCYVALFEDQEAPLENSRLILGLNKTECYNKGSHGLVFPTKELLPEVFMNKLSKERFSIVVQVLYQGGNRLGYVILSFEDGINKNYEIIRYRLSVSLKSTILIDRISKQAASLEKQVIARTKQLSESNRSLMAEIKKRKAVEEQLKKALRDLGYYNEQLHLQSMRDDLTQLYNRRGFMKMGNDCYENAKKNVQGLLLLYVDLDDLKKINDQYGHNEGDYAIAQAAEILNKTFRSSDIICRLGGDEFTILIEDASLADEGEIRRRIQHYCDLHNAASQKPYQLSMSMGAAAYTPDSDKTFEMLMKEADLALYEEKQRKHGKTQCFE